MSTIACLMPAKRLIASDMIGCLCPPPRGGGAFRYPVEISVLPCFRHSVYPSFRNSTWFPDDYRRTIRGMALILYIVIKACQGLHAIANY